MYTCDGCRKMVRAVAGDAIHFVGSRRVCATCNRRDAHAASTSPSSEAARACSSTRAEATRKRWAELSETQRAVRLAALAKGRAARRVVAEHAAVGT